MYIAYKKDSICSDFKIGIASIEFEIYTWMIYLIYEDDLCHSFSLELVFSCAHINLILIEFFQFSINENT